MKKILGAIPSMTTPIAKKDAEVLPKIPPDMVSVAGLLGTVHAEMKRCGRSNCRCAQGLLHGPYHYLYYREDGHLRKRYVKRTELDAIQEQCVARRMVEQEESCERRRRKAAERAANEEYKRLVALLRELDRSRRF